MRPDPQKEPARLRFDEDSNLYVVEILSTILDKWMVVEEHPDLVEAIRDYKDWL